MALSKPTEPERPEGRGHDEAGNGLLAPGSWEGLGFALCSLTGACVSNISCHFGCWHTGSMQCQPHHHPFSRWVSGETQDRLKLGLPVSQVIPISTVAKGRVLIVPCASHHTSTLPPIHPYRLGGVAHRWCLGEVTRAGASPGRQEEVGFTWRSPPLLAGLQRGQEVGRLLPGTIPSHSARFGAPTPLRKPQHWANSRVPWENFP